MRVRNLVSISAELGTILVIAGGVAVTACGEDQTRAPDSASQALVEGRTDLPPSATSVWLEALPPGFSSAAEVASTEVLGCRIAVGTATEMPPFPPVYHAWMSKQPLDPARPATCWPSGYLDLGGSYLQPMVLLATTPVAPNLVAAYTFKETPSGAAFLKLALVEVAFRTGAAEHRAVLGALPSFGTGVVTPDAMTLSVDGDLVVTGTKNGVIPGETGSGASFTATYLHFVHARDFAPAPTEVVAY